MWAFDNNKVSGQTAARFRAKPQSQSARDLPCVMYKRGNCIDNPAAAPSTAEWRYELYDNCRPRQGLKGSRAQGLEEPREAGRSTRPAVRSAPPPGGPSLTTLGFGSYSLAYTGLHRTPACSAHVRAGGQLALPAKTCSMEKLWRLVGSLTTQGCVRRLPSDDFSSATSTRPPVTELSIRRQSALILWLRQATRTASPARMSYGDPMER